MGGSVGSAAAIGGRSASGQANLNEPSPLALDGRPRMRQPSRAEGVRTMPPTMEIGLLLLAQAAANPDLPALPAPVTLPACPPGRSAGDIVVCGRRNDGGGYRLPAPDRFDPAGPVDSVSRE